MSVKCCSHESAPKQGLTGETLRRAAACALTVVSSIDGGQLKRIGSRLICHKADGLIPYSISEAQVIDDIAMATRTPAESVWR